uniref:Uncharacterized protein n=1 Tax=Anopheles quadriannulatus TaxID=34691 RepID=A0A182XQT3_ANOQN
MVYVFFVVVVVVAHSSEMMLHLGNVISIPVFFFITLIMHRTHYCLASPLWTLLPTCLWPFCIVLGKSDSDS